MLFEHQTHLGREHLLRYANELGLDMPAGSWRSWTTKFYRRRVLRAPREAGERSGVRGTSGSLDI